MSEFKRPGTADTGLEEPYGSLAALLSDLDEQVELFGKQNAPDDFVTPILKELRTRLTGLMLITMLKGGAIKPKPEADKS